MIVAFCLVATVSWEVSQKRTLQMTTALVEKSANSTQLHKAPGSKEQIFKSYPEKEQKDSNKAEKY